MLGVQTGFRLCLLTVTITLVYGSTTSAMVDISTATSSIQSSPTVASPQSTADPSTDVITTTQASVPSSPLTTIQPLPSTPSTQNSTGQSFDNTSVTDPTFQATEQTTLARNGGGSPLFLTSGFLALLSLMAGLYLLRL